MLKSKHLTVLAIVVVGAIIAYLAMLDRSPSAPHVEGAVLREPQPFPGSSTSLGIRRIPPRDDGDPGLLGIVQRAIGDGDGTIAYLGTRAEGDRRFGPLEERIRPVDEAPFGDRDSEAALAALREMNAEYLIVSTLDPPIPPWPTETSSTIHELLRDGIAPPQFQPVAVGRAHVVYRIAPPLEVSEAQRRLITAYLRARLAGDDTPPEVDLPPDDRARAPDGKVRVLLSLRAHEARCAAGRAITRRTGEGRTLREALDAAARGARGRWTRDRDRAQCQAEVPETIDAALPRLDLQVEIVHRMAGISDRTQDRLYYLIELGREGVYLTRGTDTFLVSPNRTIQESIETEQGLVERLGRWNELSEDAWADRANGFGRFETVAWIEPSPLAEPVELYRGLPLVTFDRITREQLVDALVLAANFLVRSQTPEGEYRYIYRPFRDDRWSDENNIVRAGLCPKVVIMAHELRPDPALLASARRGIDYTLRFLQRGEGRCWISHQDPGDTEPNVKMGVVAVTIISILELARVDSIEAYRDELECLANQLLAMQQPSGQFTHYDVPRGHRSYGQHNTIYPGEIMLAISRMYEFTHEARFKQAFDRALEFQRNWFRTTRAQTTPDGIYPDNRRIDLIAFEPWGIMAVEDMYRQTGEQQYVDFGFELVEFMDGSFHYDLGRAQYPDYVGGYFKTQLELPAINSCGYTEGAAAAYAIALRSGERIEERRLALLLGLRFVLQLQYRPGESLFHVPDPATASGGFRYNLSASRVRNDYMYHAMNALALAAFTLRPQDYPPYVRVDDVPEILEPAFPELPVPPGPPPSSFDAGPAPADAGPDAAADAGPAVDAGSDAAPAVPDARPVR